MYVLGLIILVGDLCWLHRLTVKVGRVVGPLFSLLELGLFPFNVWPNSPVRLCGPRVFSLWLPHDSSYLLSFCQQKVHFLLGTCSPCMGTSWHCGHSLILPGTAHLGDHAGLFLFHPGPPYHYTCLPSHSCVFIHP